MRKFFSLLAALSAIVAVSSCKLDKEQNYIFAYEGHVSLADKDDAQAVTEYLKNNFVNENVSSSYFGFYHEALTHAVQFFKESSQTMDDSLLFSYIKEDGDSIQLIGVMSGEKTREAVALFIWNNETRDQTSQDQ